MRSKYLPFSPPSIQEEEIEGVIAALKSGWISRGPRTTAFEEAFRDHLGSPDALAVNSCTAALHLALLVHDLGAGDEIVTSTMTFAASVNVIEHVGARPVLVDVEPDTLNLDPDAVRAAITERTRAIIVVHYGGHPADLSELRGIAQEHDLVIIEDAAHALPARYDGALIGSSASLTAFSFYATKNLTTGEGGMLTGDPALLERARVLSLHGMSKHAWSRYSREASWFYEIVEPGYKYNMSDIQAAIGLAQLKRLDSMQARRRQAVSSYLNALGDLEEVEVPCARSNVDTAWHLFPIRLRGDVLRRGRSTFMEEMDRRGIGTSVHFIPVHLHPYYRDKYGYAQGQFPVAEAAYETLVSLPLHSGLTDDDTGFVIGAIRDVVSGVGVQAR